MIAGQKTEIRSKLWSDLDTDAQGYQKLQNPNVIISQRSSDPLTIPWKMNLRYLCWSK